MLNLQLDGLPASLTLPEMIAPPNEPLMIRQGKLVVAKDGKRVDLAGELRQQWVPRVAVVFEGGAASPMSESDLLEGRLKMPDVGLSVPASVATISSDGLVATGLVHGLVRLGDDGPLSHVDFCVTNFHDYIGEWIRTQKMESKGACAYRGRITFVAHGWRVLLDQDPQIAESEKCATAHGGFATTHAGRLFRASGRSFTGDKAADFLSMLTFFFALLRGCWCGPVLPVAYDGGDEKWREWGPWLLTPAGRHFGSWFPRDRVAKAGPLLGAFRRRWREPVWNDALRTAIHWYVHANGEARTVEAGVVASFVALELLAWLQMVEVSQRHSATKFGKLRGKAKLRLLLKDRGIPPQIPARFHRLRRAARTRNWSDGPAALTAIRNSVVHARRPRRQRLRRVSGSARVEVRELAREYVELTLLSLLDYDGYYAQRAFEGWRGEELRLVPWG